MKQTAKYALLGHDKDFGFYLVGFGKLLDSSEPRMKSYTMQTLTKRKLE